MTTDEQDSDNPEERNEEPHTVTGDALEAVRAAYSHALEAQLAAAPDERDLYVKLGIVLLAAGHAVKRGDAAKLGKIAHEARRVLDELGVEWMPEQSHDLDNAGGPLVQKKDFAPRAAAHVESLFTEILADRMDADQASSWRVSAHFLAAHLPRIIMSGPWASLCDDRAHEEWTRSGNWEVGKRICDALTKKFGRDITRDDGTTRAVLRVALEALGASKEQSKAATRQV